MGILTEADELRIKSIAEEFTVQSIGNQNPENMCFLTCYPLSLFLKIKRVNTSLNGGTYKSKNHNWLNLENYEGIILDPTIRQFEEGMEPVYVGNTTQYYNPHSCPFNDWFKLTYNAWKVPFSQFPFPPEFKQKAILYNLKAATILNTEIEQMETDLKERFMQWDQCKDYFYPINKFLINRLESDIDFINDLTSVLPEGFNNLLSKAISSRQNNTKT